MAPLAQDLDYLIQAEKFWDDDTLKSRISMGCQNPAAPSGAVGRSKIS